MTHEFSARNSLANDSQLSFNSAKNPSPSRSPRKQSDLSKINDESVQQTIVFKAEAERYREEIEKTRQELIVAKQQYEALMQSVSELTKNNETLSANLKQKDEVLLAEQTRFKAEKDALNQSFANQEEEL